MNDSLTRLVRPDLLNLQAYPAASPDREFLRLHANESPYGALTGLNLYPEPQPWGLIDRLSDLYEVNRDNLLLTRGSDDAIDLLLRCFCRAGIDSIIVCPPTFGMYEMAARLQNAGVTKVPLDATDGFKVDRAAIQKACVKSTRLVFLCTPNNPTGNLVAKQCVIDLCESLQGKALVVIDEAYIEFAQSESLARLVNEYSNLVVLRTLSKAFALAGARCGALIAAPALVELVRPAMPPYALPTPTINVVTSVLQENNLDELRHYIAKVCAEREILSAQLEVLPAVQKLWPSRGNFILIEVDDAAAVVAACRDNGILVRNVSAYDGLSRHIRVTVGQPEENRTLLAVLGAL